MSKYSEMPTQWLVAEHKRLEAETKAIVDVLVKRIIAAEEAGDEQTAIRIERDAGIDEGYLMALSQITDRAKHA